MKVRINKDNKTLNKVFDVIKEIKMFLLKDENDNYMLIDKRECKEVKYICPICKHNVYKMTNVTNGELYFCNNKNGSHYFNNDDDLIIKGVGNTKEV